MSENDKNIGHINCKIDPELKQDFKLACLKKKTTMSEVLVSAIQKYVDDNRNEL